MVQRAVDEVARVRGGQAAAAAGLVPESIDAIYLTGGSSRLPLVPVLVRKALPGIRVVMTDKPWSSVATGAAIVASEWVKVSDIMARHFGVIRLRLSGTTECFSPILGPGTRLPGRGEPPIEVEVSYGPEHNIGRLQYLECGALGGDGMPAGEARRWSEILFPYDPAIPLDAPLQPADVAPAPHLRGTTIVERYRCDSDGVISVRIERRADGRARTFEIARD
jgi:hypothetical protein